MGEREEHIATGRNLSPEGELLPLHGGGKQRRWRWIRGHFPVPARCRHRNSGPPKLVGDGGGDRNCFWRKKGSILGVSTPRGKYRRRGASRGPTRQSGGSLARPRVGPRHLPSWLPGGGPPPLLWWFRKLPLRWFFYIFSPEFLEHF